MSKITSYAAVLVVGAIMVGLLAAPVNALTATAPEWNVGDSWGMGKEIDLGNAVTENFDEISAMALAQLGLTIDDLRVDSKASAYALFKVLSETTTTYTVEAKVAMKFATQANIAVTGPMPKAGTYDSDEDLFSVDSTVEKETKTSTLGLTEKMGIVVKATMVVDKADFAIYQLDWSVKAAMSFEFDATNIPEFDDDLTEQTLSYKNYDLGAEIVVNLDVTMMFEPGLDLYQFPFSPGDEWFTNTSMVTMNGQIGGLFNAHGLTAEQKASIFTEDLKNATGATDFPISFDKLTSPDEKIKDGKFGPVYANTTETRMECTDAYTKMFGDLQLDVFEIEVGYSGKKMLYTPGFKVIGAVLDPASLPIEVQVAMQAMGLENAEMDPVTSAKATAEISSIETYTNNVANEAGGSSNGIADFFFKAPFLGVILIIVVVVIIGAAFILMKRARKP